MNGVMRQLRWSKMSEAERTALCARGIAEIFDPELRASIATLIDDVRSRGDAAVCDALARFDGVEVEPADLRVGPDELAAA
jgi:histidinol dehydrogenase